MISARKLAPVIRVAGRISHATALSTHSRTKHYQLRRLSFQRSVHPHFQFLFFFFFFSNLIISDYYIFREQIFIHAIHTLYFASRQAHNFSLNSLSARFPPSINATKKKKQLRVSYGYIKYNVSDLPV